MAIHSVGLSDLTRDPADVARRLPQWARGDRDEAAVATLLASARTLHDRAYTAWVWSARTVGGLPAWILPVRAEQTARFAPRGPARVLSRILCAAGVAGATLSELSLASWRGMTLVTAPGLDETIASEALALTHPGPARVALAVFPDGVEADTPIELEGRPPARRGPVTDIVALAAATRVHPVQVVIALADHHQDVDRDEFDPEIIASLRLWGCDGPPEVVPELSLAIEDDPCPRRRHARRALQRLLGMKKIGPLYHTEFDHFARGTAPSDRGEALMVGHELVRAGLLGTKPSVGQLHVYLRRDALPEIHALIEHGATDDPRLAELWSAPPPGQARRRT